MAGSTSCVVLRPAVGNRLTAVRWPPAALSGGFSTSACTWATVMLSRASTTRHRLNPRLVGSGRYWMVRASALAGQGLDRSPGIPGLGGARITPPGRRPDRLPRSSSMALTYKSFLRSRSAAFSISPARVWDWFPWLRAKPKRLAACNTSPGRPAISAREDAMLRPH